MNTNAKLSEHISVLATVDAVSQAPGAVSTGWVSIKNHFGMLALIDVGVFGAVATVDAKLQQAQDAVGTNVKDITGKAITQLIAAGGNNRQALINAKVADLDTEGAFSFVRLTVTVGTAATQINATLIGAYPRYKDGALFNQVGVAQIV